MKGSLTHNQDDGYYTQFFLNAKAIMLIIDPDEGKIHDANISACNFYGYNVDEFKKQIIQDINQLSHKEVEEEMQMARQEKRTFFRFVHKLANGEFKHVDVNSGPILIDGKQFLYSIINVQ